jgi:RNA ligase
MDKRDGSMVHPVLVNGKIILKTKKAFYSDVAILATKLLHSDKCKKILAYCVDAVQAQQTPIFEFTSPSARIVLPYAEDELKLLHIRHNVSGEYAGPDVIKFIGADYGIPTVDEFDPSKVSKDSILNSMEFDQNKEGYVIEFEDGQMVKGKTQWYLDLHRTIVFVRERDIAEMVVNETVDDYKSALSLSGESLDAVLDIEQRVLDEVRKIEAAVEEAYQLIKHCADRKTAAMSIKGHPWFGAAMAAYTGKEFDVKEHFLKFVLKEKFSLEQV